MKKVVSIAAFPLLAVLLSACGGGGGASPASALQSPPPSIAVGEPSPSAPPATADFVRLARESACSDQRNRLYLIDRKQVFWDRAGSCADASYAQVLYGATPQQTLCSAGDSIAGPRTGCTDERYRAQFDTMLKNLDQADLGLGATHTVERLSVLPRDGSSLNFTVLAVDGYTGIRTERTVAVTDAAVFSQLWTEFYANRTLVPALPKIDFTRQMVVGVFTGTHPNGCSSVAIARTGIADSKLSVEYGLGRVVETALCTQAITTPGTLAVVERVDAPVQFTRIVPEPLMFSKIDAALNASPIDSKPASAVVKDADHWARVWARYGAPNTPLPAVDFGRSMVLFQFFGVYSGCKTDRVDSVALVNGRIYVNSSYTPPGPASVCLAAFMAQGDIVVTPRSDLPVEFVYKRNPDASL